MLRHERDPWGPLSPRRQWKHDHGRARQDAADLAEGLVCGTCGRPVGEEFYPRCPTCPAEPHQTAEHCDDQHEHPQETTA